MILEKLAKMRATLFKGLNAPYRLVCINDQSLREVASLKLTKSRVFIYVSSLFVAISLVTVFILVSTPLRYYVPGYGSGKTHRDVVLLKRQVDSLADLVATQETYAANIRKVINGDYDGKADTTMLDLNQVHRQAMRDILPATEEIKKEALGIQPKAKSKSNRKRKRRR